MKCSKLFYFITLIVLLSGCTTPTSEKGPPEAASSSVVAFGADMSADRPDVSVSPELPVVSTATTRPTGSDLISISEPPVSNAASAISPAETGGSVAAPAATEPPQTDVGAEPIYAPILPEEGALGAGRVIPRDEIEAKVYAAVDYVGVSNDLKDMFVDFILTSDWFAVTCIDAPYQAEWFFDTNENGYTQLCVKTWDTAEDWSTSTEYKLNTLFYNGECVMDGLRSMAHSPE